MATVKVILETRNQRKDGTFPLKFRVTHNRKYRDIGLGIYLLKKQWYAESEIVLNLHPDYEALNTEIKTKKLEIEQIVTRLESRCKSSTLKDIVSAIKLSMGKKASSPKKRKSTTPTFFEYGYKLVERLKKSQNLGNARAYENTLNRLRNHLGHDNLKFSDIDYEFLEEFDADFLAQGIKINTISFYLRTVRAIYNKAIKAKVVKRELYPFHDFSIKREATQKRAISKEKMRLLAKYPLDQDTPIWHNRNFFIMSFLLIGISFVDLTFLKWSDIKGNRITYKRRKTAKFYNIQLTSKAQKVIEYYKAYHDSIYIFPIIPKEFIGDAEKELFYSRQGYKQCNKYIKQVAAMCEIEENVTTYVARHSWATIAKKLGYSKDLIAEALGHEYGNKVTGVYLDNYEKEIIDEANAKVTSVID